MVTLLFAGIIVAAVVLDLAVIQPLERRRRPADDRPEPLVEFIVPRSVFLHPGHAWVRIEVDGQVTVGVDDLLRTVLGPVRPVDLPTAGAPITAGLDTVGLAHDGATLRLPVPVSGTVTRVNPSFGADPTALRARPYRDGWLYRLEPGDDLAAELARLKVGRRATDWMRAEAERLRQMFADDVLVGPVDGVLHRSGEATWRVFDERFLGPGRATGAVEV